MIVSGTGGPMAELCRPLTNDDKSPTPAARTLASFHAAERPCRPILRFVSCGNGTGLGRDPDLMAQALAAGGQRVQRLGLWPLQADSAGAGSQGVMHSRMFAQRGAAAGVAAQPSRGRGRSAAASYVCAATPSWCPQRAFAPPVGACGHAGTVAPLPLRLPRAGWRTRTTARESGMEACRGPACGPAAVSSGARCRCRHPRRLQEIFAHDIA